MAMILVVGGEHNNLSLELDSFNGTVLRAYASGYPNPRAGVYYWFNAMWSYYGHWWYKKFPGGVRASEIYTSMSFCTSTTNWAGINATILCWRNGATNLGTLQWEGAGSYKLYTGNNATMVAQSAANWNVAANTWVTLELHIKLHASQGIIALRINGVDAASWTGNTIISGCTTIDGLSAWNGAGGNSQSLYWDDLVVNDTTGAYNNSWVGGARVVLVRPTGAGTTTQLTPSSGANYTCVNENPPTMNSYCAGAANGLLDTYALADLANIQQISAVRVDTLVCRQGTGPPIRIAPALRTGGQNIIATPQATGLSLGVLYSNIWEINPVTNLPWTLADINALEAGGQVAT